MLTVGLAAIGLGGSIAAGIGLAVHAFADFDHEMSAVKAATHESAKNMDLLRAAAIKAGADTVFSATEAAQAEEALAKAGVSTKDVLAGGLNGALSLAAAGQMAVADAAETAATAMTQFGLSGDKVPHIADLLAAGAGKAQGEVSDLAYALKQSGLVAAQFGLSIDDTVGTLSAFASAGLLGSDAGTSFRTMLLRLANPAQQAAEEMKTLGINAYDAQGNFVGIKNLAGQLHDKLGGLTQAQRNAALATIFGNDAIRAANVLYTQGATGIQGWVDKVNDAGYAAQTAQIKMDNLQGDLEQLSGSLDTALIQSGSKANGVLRYLTQQLTDLVNAYSSLPGPVQAAILVGGGLVAAISLIGGSILVVLPRIAAFNAALTQMGIKWQVTRTALSTGAKFTGILAAAFALRELGQVLYDNFGPKAPDIHKTIEALHTLAANGKADSFLIANFGKNLDDLHKQVKRLTAPSLMDQLDDWSTKILTLGVVKHDEDADKFAKNFESIDAALARFVQSGNADVAAAALAKLGLSTKQQEQLLPQYTDAVKNANEATTDTGSVAEKVKEQLGGLTSGFDNASDAADALQQTLDSLLGVHTDAERAVIQYEKAIDDLTAGIKDNGTSLDADTEAGRSNLSAILDITDAAQKAAIAKLKESGSVDQAKNTYDGYIAKLHDTLRAAGFTEKQTQDLIRTYGQIPPSVFTSIAANTGQATQAITQLEQQLAALQNARYEVRIKAAVSDHDLITIAASFGRKVAMAEGGPVTGGVPGKDSVLRMLMPDEYVVNAAASRQFRPFLDAINYGYASGGLVRRVIPQAGSAGGMHKEYHFHVDQLPGQRDQAQALIGQLNKAEFEGVL